MLSGIGLLGILFILAHLMSTVGGSSHRDAARIAAAVSTAQRIKNAFITYAIERADNAFPPADYIRDFATSRAVVNKYGGNLKETEEPIGIRFVSYETPNISGKGRPDHYILTLSVLGWGKWPGTLLRVAPDGIEKLGASSRRR